MKNSTSHNAKQTKWFVYIIRCGDDSLYTGITTDVERRFQEHSLQGTKTAKYLRGQQPLSLVCVIDANSQADALRLEHEIKRMPKTKKEALLNQRK